jgi:hypothetical protein
MKLKRLFSDEHFPSSDDEFMRHNSNTRTSIHTVALLLILGLAAQGWFPQTFHADAKPDSPVTNAMIIATSEDGNGYNITMPNGNYVITQGLTTGSYSVNTFAEGYINQEINGISVTVGTLTENINFNLKRSGGISGTVKDSTSGVGIADAVITAFNHNNYGWFAVTDASGNYKMITNLETGVYNVTVTSVNGYFTKTVNAVNVAAGVEANNVNFALDRSAIISGKVMNPSGLPVKGVTVTAISTGGTNFMGFALTEADGSFRIESGLGSGSYMVTVYSGTSFDQKSGVSATVGKETSGVNLTLDVTVQPSGIITGLVTDTKNTPIVGARVSAGSGYDNTNADGVYEISNGLPTGTYTVDVSAAGYQAQEKAGVSVTAGSTTSNINFKLAKIPAASSGKISGKVLGEDNPLSSRKPITISCASNQPSIKLGEKIVVSGALIPSIAGISVNIEYKSGTAEVSRVATTGSDGKYSDTYSPTIEGSWTVEAAWVGNTEYSGAGSEKVTFTVSAIAVTTGGIKITVKDKDGKPLAGSAVASKTTPSGQAALTGVSASDGAIDFNGVAAGAYTFEASLKGYVTNSGAGTVSAGSSSSISITLQTQSTGGGSTTSGGGVPGFSYEVVLLGILASAVIMYLWKKD